MITKAAQSLSGTPLTIVVLTWIVVPVAAAIVEGTIDGAWSPFVLVALELLWIVFGMISASWSVRYFRKRAWALALLTLTLPLAIITSGARSVVTVREEIKGANDVSMLFPFMVADDAMLTLLRPALYVGDVAHFLVVKPSYDAQIAGLRADGNRFQEFSWGGWLFSSSGVVYDETDEIARPAERRSPAWVARFKNTDLICGGKDLVADARPLWSHYYLAGFGC